MHFGNRGRGEEEEKKEEKEEEEEEEKGGEGRRRKKRKKKEEKEGRRKIKKKVVTDPLALADAVVDDGVVGRRGDETAGALSDLKLSVLQDDRSTTHNHHGHPVHFHPFEDVVVASVVMSVLPKRKRECKNGNHQTTTKNERYLLNLKNSHFTVHTIESTTITTTITTTNYIPIHLTLEMTLVASGSQTTMSASLPTAILPFRG